MSAAKTQYNSWMQPILTIHLDKLVQNYQTLSQKFSGEATGAVVKANAYGLGALEVSLRLIKAGCKHLFVATLEEAMQLKTQLLQHLPEKKLPSIYVFHGPYTGQEADFIAHGFVPVINHINQLERWMLASEPASHAPYILHVDTGMNRLGLSISDMEWLKTHGTHLLERSPIYLMSHLACANDPEHEKNKEQLARFQAAQQLYPGVKTTFCNSAGIYLDRIYHGELARPGCSLYGIRPNSALNENPMQHVADLDAPILMIRELSKPETVGYGATVEMPAGSRVAIVQMGYADGYLRYLSNKGCVFIGPYPCDVIGRVSMDMIAVDVTHLPPAELSTHKYVSILCELQPVDNVAEQADTIGYEILTSLKGRVVRRYIEDK